jgi:hypothetical protein
MNESMSDRIGDAIITVIAYIGFVVFIVWRLHG